MNAAIDQQCEIYIRENGLVEEVEKEKIAAIYAKKGTAAKVRESCPKATTGLG
jgi:methylmalonyl-CoA mutase